jgi:predicted nucleic acid-binding protein
MPAGADRPDQLDALVDTGVAVALVVADHEHHASTSAAVGARKVGLAGHAAFETFSVLTRLPPPLRRTPRAVHKLLVSNFPPPCFLGPTATGELWARLPHLGVAGGAVYDGLVGAAAGACQLPLLTRDRRALEIYAALGIEVELLGPE